MKQAYLFIVILLVQFVCGTDYQKQSDVRIYFLICLLIKIRNKLPNKIYRFLLFLGV